MSPMNPADPVLIVDDEPSWRRTLSLALQRSAGLDNLLQAGSGREALELLEELRVSLILLDITMPDGTGDEVLETLQKRRPEIPVIIVTGRGEVELAVRCMQLGAFDYVMKTSEQERLLASVQRALALGELREENRQLRESLLRPTPRHPEAFADFITSSPTMLDIFRYLEAVAGSREPVLITGESGTGKELVARALHRLGHADGPWQAVNVAGLDDQVFADTLFGHLRGAFTGADRSRPGMVEQAAGGVLFLDEIGDLGPASQVKLLRFLQEGEYYPLGSDRPKRSNARVVAATNRNLESEVAEERFRRDLFYRLRSHHVHLPPLRERPGDLPLLVDHFLEEAAESLGRIGLRISQGVLPLLRSHDFPGNVRELRALVFDAASQQREGRLGPESFEAVLGSRETTASPKPEPDQDGERIRFGNPLPTLKEVADLLVEEALRRTGGNQTQAARLLGISRPALNKRLRK